MKSLSFLTASVIMFNVVSSPALASSRTFVSGGGSDSGSCGLAAPCRTFAYAITQTNDGGEIVILNSAGYGPVTITQSVTISNPGGVEAGITVGAGQTGITINAPSTASITLRGIALFGGGVGANGVVMNSGGFLNVIGGVIKDFTANGIAINPSSGTLFALISDTHVLSNGGTGSNGTGGIHVVTTTSAVVKVTIVRVTAKDNGQGIFLDASAGGRVDGVISGSHTNYNNANGITAAGAGSSCNVYVHIKDSYAIANGIYGISAQNAGQPATLDSGCGIALDNIYSITNLQNDLANPQPSMFTFGNNVYGDLFGAGPIAANLR